MVAAVLFSEYDKSTCKDSMKQRKYSLFSLGSSEQSRERDKTANDRDDAMKTRRMRNAHT
jgi:hypothetical protein